MNNIAKSLTGRVGFGSLIACTLPLAAQAQSANIPAVVNYSTVAPPVPLPVNSLLWLTPLVLAVLLVGARYIWQHPSVSRILTVVAGMGLVAFMGGRIDDSLATVVPDVEINGSGCAGGSANFDAYFSGPLFINGCPNELVIDSYEAECGNLFLDTSQCPAGTVIAPGSNCPLPFCSQGG